MICDTGTDEGNPAPTTRWVTSLSVTMPRLPSGCGISTADSPAEPMARTASATGVSASTTIGGRLTNSATRVDDVQLFDAGWRASIERQALLATKVRPQRRPKSSRIVSAGSAITTEGSIAQAENRAAAPMINGRYPKSSPGPIISNASVMSSPGAVRATRPLDSMDTASGAPSPYSATTPPAGIRRTSDWSATLASSSSPSSWNGIRAPRNSARATPGSLTAAVRRSDQVGTLLGHGHDGDVGVHHREFGHRRRIDNP